MGLQIMRLFRELVQGSGVTIVMRTHDTGMMDLADAVFAGGREDRAWLTCR